MSWGRSSVNKQASQSCAVAKSENFWRGTGQSNLVYKPLAATKDSKVWFSYSRDWTFAIGAVFHSVCQVWLSSDPSEVFNFSYCAWLGNCLLLNSIRTKLLSHCLRPRPLTVKFYLVQWRPWNLHTSLVRVVTWDSIPLACLGGDDFPAGGRGLLPQNIRYVNHP